MGDRLPRRALLGGALASAALAACGRGRRAGGPPSGPGTATLTGAELDAASAAGEIPTRTLGRTGVTVSLVGLGGYHAGALDDEQQSIRLIRSAIDRGVTFMDNCWDYNQGRSESRMGKALEGGYRDRVFLMTKIDGRTKKAAAAQIDQSLARLRVSHIDLVQIHEIIRWSDPERCFSDGCVEALVDAQRAGKLRFIGFTGHKDPEMHLAMLRAADANHFSFDTIQMPLNVMDAHFRSFQEKVLPVAVAKGMGVLAMKALGSGDILASGTASPIECLQYPMGLPASVVITGCESARDLDQAVRAATTFRPPEPRTLSALLERTRGAAMTGRYERFKTSTRYDGTERNPHWLETARI